MNTLNIPNTLLSQLNTYNIFPSDLVFYINSTCNLRCKHCYIGNDLLSLNQSYALPDVIKFINSFNKLDRITILGGEPFLYEGFDILLNSLDLSLINEFRVTSNLTEISPYKKFNDDVKQKLNLCVSLDGHNEKEHDFIRGKNSFNRTIKNLEKLIEDKINIEVTYTLTNKNIKFFDEFLVLCKGLGIKNVNIHRMSLQGNALQIQDLQVTPSDYVKFFNNLKSQNIPNGNLKVRLPVSFTTQEKYDYLVKESGYKHHALKSFYGDNQRIVIYPTREIYISSELFGTESFIGKFDDENFHYNDSEKNELSFFKDPTASISDLNLLQSGDEQFPIVLSVSYKETISL